MSIRISGLPACSTVTYRFIDTPAGRFNKVAVDVAGGLHQGLTAARQYLARHFSAQTQRKYEALQLDHIAWFEAVAPGGAPFPEIPALFAKYLEHRWGCQVRRLDRDGYHVKPRTCSADHVRAVNQARTSHRTGVPRLCPRP